MVPLKIVIYLGANIPHFQTHPNIVSRLFLKFWWMNSRTGCPGTLRTSRSNSSWCSASSHHHFEQCTRAIVEFPNHRNHGFCGQTPCFSQIWDSTSWFFKEVREFHMFVGSYPHPMLAAYHHVVLSKLGDTNTPCMAIWMGKRGLRVPSAFPNKLISYFWLHIPFHPWKLHDFSFGCRLFLLFQADPRLKAHTPKLTSTIAATNYV